MIIFKQALKRIFKNKIRVVVLLIMPILFILMYAMQEKSTLTIAVVDKDNSKMSTELVTYLKGLNQVKIITLKEDDVFDKSISYETEYSIIIPEGFEEKLLTGKETEIQEFYINSKEKLFYARSAVDSYINNIKLLAKGTNYDKVKFETAFSEFNVHNLSYKNIGAVDKNNERSKLAMGFLVQFMLYMSVITASIILEDKSNGVFYRVFYAPVSAKRYMLENLMAFLVVAVIQVLFILSLVKFIWDMNLGTNVVNMGILFIVFSLVCVSLGVFLVSITKKPIYAYSLILALTTPLVMLGGCYWPQESMPDLINKIALFIPTTWVIKAVEKLINKNMGLLDICPDIFILLIFAGIFFAAGLFKKVDISK